MGRCSYTWEEWDEEKSDFVRRRCLEETWSRSEKFCIFHDPSPDKDGEQFEEKLREKLAGKDYFFDGYFFPEIDFRNEVFEGKVFFNNATFQDAALFIGATFQENADFSGATFQGNANFWKATFQGNANFSSASFQEIADFREATFQETMEFRRTIFQKTADLNKGIFQDGNFIGATFQDKAFFSEAIFHRDAEFNESVFNAGAYFIDTTFQKKAIFLSATFQKTYFRIATFKGDTDFSRTSFKNYTSFYGSDFTESTDFLAARFEGNTDFRDTIFRDANFRGSIFKEKLEFVPKKVGRVDFRDAEFLFRSSITSNLANVLFHRSFIENVAFINCEWPKKYVVYEEKHMEDKDIGLFYNQLETIYRNLKQNMQNHGDYATAGELYYREMEMRRKGAKTKRKRLWLEIYRILAGYGENYWNTAVVSVVITLFFAFLYGIFDCLQYSVEDPSLLQETIDAIYFSFVTFTTLGLGDIAPLTAFGKVLICCEAVTGAFMIALFVVVFVRKMAR
jgi:uncharacterized protein YjbI with pentapeptide repeats